MTNDPTGNAPASEGSPSVVGPLGPTAAGGREPHAGGGAWTPSRRLTVILTVAMLGIGIAVGSAVGPAPSASFAGPGALPLLLRSLLAGRTADTPAAAPATGSGAV